MCHATRFTCHVLYAMCHMSPVMCHMSCVMCYMPCVICHLSCVICHVYVSKQYKKSILSNRKVSSCASLKQRLLTELKNCFCYLISKFFSTFLLLHESATPLQLQTGCSLQKFAGRKVIQSQISYGEVKIYSVRKVSQNSVEITLFPCCSVAELSSGDHRYIK